MTENIPLSTRLKNCGIGILRILIINFYFLMTNKTKPSRQEMLDAIYEKIARKDLSFGCCFQGGKSSYVIQNPY